MQQVSYWQVSLTQLRHYFHTYLYYPKEKGSNMKVGSSEYQTLLNIVKTNPKITSTDAIKRLHEEVLRH